MASDSGKRLPSEPVTIDPNPIGGSLRLATGEV
jgi:hypothetical protein